MNSALPGCQWNRPHLKPPENRAHNGGGFKGSLHHVRRELDSHRGGCCGEIHRRGEG